VGSGRKEGIVSKSPWKHKELLKAFDQQEAGKSVAEIGRDIGRTRASVSAALRRWRFNGLLPHRSNEVGKPAFLKRRNAEIVEMRSSGATYWDIAEKYEISDRRVSVILQRARESATQ
jgi:transcriptional regulator